MEAFGLEFDFDPHKAVADFAAALGVSLDEAMEMVGKMLAANLYIVTPGFLHELALEAVKRTRNLPETDRWFDDLVSKGTEDGSLPNGVTPHTLLAFALDRIARTVLMQEGHDNPEWERLHDFKMRQAHALLGGLMAEVCEVLFAEQMETYPVSEGMKQQIKVGATMFATMMKGGVVPGFKYEEAP